MKKPLDTSFKIFTFESILVILSCSKNKKKTKLSLINLIITNEFYKKTTLILIVNLMIFYGNAKSIIKLF